MSTINALLQILLVSIMIFFISGRLIGSNVNLFRRVLSVIISVSFTTFVFWYTYIRENPQYEDGVVSVATLLWIGSMLLISMLIYLFFELFDPIALDEGARRYSQKTIFRKMVNYWRYQKRLRTVLKAAVTNGITKTVKYARNRDTDKQLAIALRATLEESGGIFIKFGQVLSTRKELFSPVFIEELKKLQQKVSPMTYDEVKTVLKENYNRDPEDVFSFFEEKPLAAASIGQVHRAVLKDTHEEVVVKILRPQIKTIMREDLSILLEFADWITAKSQWAESMGFKALAEGFANSMKEETDFSIEARNMIQIRNVLKHSELNVKIPRVYEEFSNENILVMEYVKGVSISELDKVDDKQAIDRRELARTLMYSYLEQALISGIFHADPHPGNISVNPETGELAILDFGAVCRLSGQQQEGLKLFFIGIQQGDASILFDAISLLIKNKDEINRQELEQAIGQILLKISYVNKIPTDETIYSIFTVIRESGLQFYSSVSLALRVIITLDGTINMLDPKFNIFDEAKEFMNNYMKASIRKPFKEPMETMEKIQEELALLVPNLRKIPRRVDQLIRKIEDGKVILHHDIFSDKTNAKFVTQLFSKFVLLMVGITFGFISTALLAISQFIETVYAIYLNTAAYLGLFLCSILLVRLSIQAIRDMKRRD
ncbi:AarF/UbiB family protein [Ureibacillus sp. FSL K6-8385]|uniref:AarF/ABC1/UbiB kinase family protein n=1 Tax=Ureibacillus terrenus TaxID=118246 RepID=A0A540V0P1_9BACL|nr:AarF/UbiB family protein [Ureibacillus terrenus]MED3661424.1 AarF/UbiB family protein [Ureibacillus terrenus]MED3763258.1 AarF/UbiB family protein [Ureibacillus terrenus]TQE90314.1 AarF/ABC1/UbiB kinase family protein [Ureibacillus terrenus]